jgi:hypothetical protein
VHFNQLANDGETQTRSGRSQNKWMFAAEKTVKDTSLILGRDAYAVILYIHWYFALLLMDAYANGAIAGRIVEGIVYEVAHDLPYTITIAQNGHYLRWRIKREPWVYPRRANGAKHQQ